MPGPRHKCYTPIKVSVDPLTKCLDANGTYICTAYNSRCYIIQKITPTVGAVPEPSYPSVSSDIDDVTNKSDCSEEPEVPDEGKTMDHRP
ncbi:hypothetical protein M8J75_008583 [Diaphorina citri]|nr:hypothetical protein M8J75_008583 [Diaphorina citri]